MTDGGDTKEASNIVPMHLLSTNPADLISHPKSSLANVKGLARSKSILRKVVATLTLTNRETPLSSLLLYGPPNCGKTYLCSILAGELQTAFLPINCGELAESAANGPRIVQDIEKIVERNMPCVLLFDEIDKLNVEEIENATHRNAVTQAVGDLLDKAAFSTEQLFIIAATATNPWLIPAELVGKGRLGEILLVLPPDTPARLAMLNSNLPDLSMEDDIDIDWLAAHTEGYSGTDLQRLCENAYDLAQSQGRRAPSMLDLKAAFNNFRPGAGAWLDRAAHQAMLSAHTGLYDDLLDYLNARSR
jgi:SpoVK/Ycf46/Vps4 family AAA+-type ATPase